MAYEIRELQLGSFIVKIPLSTFYIIIKLSKNSQISESVSKKNLLYQATFSKNVI